MSKELPPNKNGSEEIDLIVFFNLIGNLFNRALSSIRSVLKFLFSILIYTIKAFIDNWRIIMGVLIITAGLGYFIERSIPKPYHASMLVKPYFDSKYQLVTNINYFNALVASKDYETLNNVFKADSFNIDVKKIRAFSIEPGPETENDKILQYQGFLKALDSASFNVTFEDYIDNRSVFSGNLFQISVKSFDKAIFKKLEYGINTAFTNDFSMRKKKKENQLYELEKENIKENLKEVDSLQRIYISVLQEERKSKPKDIRFAGFPMQESKTRTREYELLEKEISLREKLRALEEKEISQDVFVDVISSFPHVGGKRIKLSERYSIIFPAISFILLCVLFLGNKTIKFVNNYED